MICGGTGVTPMFQVLSKVAEDKSDTTLVQLLSAQRTPEDIILRDELEKMSQENPNIRVDFVISDMNSGWEGLTGQVDRKLIEKYMPHPTAKSFKILVCGTEKMMENLCGTKNVDKTQGDLKGLLSEMGYKSDQIYKF